MMTNPSLKIMVKPVNPPIKNDGWTSKVYIYIYIYLFIYIWSHQAVTRGPPIFVVQMKRQEEILEDRHDPWPLQVYMLARKPV